MGLEGKVVGVEIFFAKKEDSSETGGGATKSINTNRK